MIGSNFKSGFVAFVTPFLVYSVVLFPQKSEAAGLAFRVIPFFSLKREAALDGRGNPIRDSKGDPVFNWTVDPESEDAITRIGFDFSYDPSHVQILEEPSTFGFLCEFSIDAICPEVNNLSTFGRPLPGSVWSFDIDNSEGRAIFSYDFSTTPVSIEGEVDFFAFQTVSVIPGMEVSDDAFVQNIDSPNQFCETTGVKKCGTPIPEPSTTTGIFAVLSLGSLLIRRNSNRQDESI